jgi:hypothetical protein
VILVANINGTNAYDSTSNSFLNTQRASGMYEIGENMGALAVTTTNIDVWANGQRVGFIQSASPSESRTINKIMELGTEGIVQSVPSNTNGGSLSVQRIAIYNSSLFNALGMTKTGTFLNMANESSVQSATTLSNDSYKVFSNVFKTLKDQRVPLEIEIKTKMPSKGGSSAGRMLIDKYVDCWIQQYSKNIASGTITITESATITYSEVYTTVTD